jgi:uncharacterized membrane protein (UPF0127 family)
MKDQRRRGLHWINLIDYSRHIALTLGLTGLLLACPNPRNGTVGVTIRGATVYAEVALTAEERALGLSGRRELAPDEAMLFLFGAPGLPGFWMPDMHFDLDLVWIRAGRIVDLTPFVSHREPDRVHRPRVPADVVLEVLAGTATLHGWRPGDRVRFDPSELPPAR